MSSRSVLTLGYGARRARPWLPAVVENLRVAQALSLDVVAGVICSAAMAVAVTGAMVPPIVWILLPAITWCVYALDHLLDARRTGSDASTFRHRFFYRHRKAIGVQLVAVGGCGGVAALAWWPKALWPATILLMGAAAAHLWMAQRAHSRRWLKELSAATAYTAGIWFAPLMVAPRIEPWVAGIVGLHFLAALSNLLMLSIFEQSTDAADGHGSLPLVLGDRFSRRIIAVLTITGLVLGTATISFGPRSTSLAAFVLLGLVLLPAVMIRMTPWFGHDERYRWCGDLAFLLTVLPWWGAMHGA